MDVERKLYSSQASNERDRESEDEREGERKGLNEEHVNCSISENDHKKKSEY